MVFLKMDREKALEHYTLKMKLFKEFGGMEKCFDNLFN
jgi:hypothetical protein